MTSKVCDMLNDIFEKGTESPTQPGGRGVNVPGAVSLPQQGEAAGLTVLSEEAVIVGKIKLLRMRAPTASTRDAAN
jgi:hypothetical protein